MGAVWMRVRSDLRTRWRSVVGLALVIGVTAGPVIAVTAGARRTDSAYPRFVREHRGADMAVENLEFALLTPDQLRGIPEVAEVEPFHWAFVIVDDTFVPAHAVSRDRTGSSIDRFKIVEGRAPDPNRPEEVLLSLLGREKGFRVGQKFPLRLPPVAEEFRALSDAFARNPMTMRIVGVAAAPGAFPPQVSEVSPLMYFTPAVYRLFPNAFPYPDPSLVRLKRGSADLVAFEDAIAELAGIPTPRLLAIFERRGHDANVQRSFHLQAVALWLLAALAGATLLLILGQLLARQAFLDSVDHTGLRSLGMTTPQLWVTSVIRAGMMGFVAAMLSVPIALALSPLMPTGLPRLAEPDPGFAADWRVIAIGAVTVVLAVVALTALPAWRASRATARRGIEEPAPSRSAAALAGAGAGPVAVTGIQLAFERGRGKTAVPVRTTIAGVTIGVTALVAALVFGQSLRHLIDTPALYGVGWDMVVAHDPTDFSEQGRRILKLPEIRAVTAAASTIPVQIEDRPLNDVLAIERVRGSRDILPPLLDGRHPDPGAEPMEVVLGSRTMESLGVRLGAIVDARSVEFSTQVKMRVVGRGVIPLTSEASRSGDGAWFWRSALLERVTLQEESQLRIPDYAFLDLATGTDPDRAFNRIAGLLGLSPEEELYRPPFATPSDLVSFGRVERLPEILGGLLGLISAATLAHVLTTAIQRRRRDLAILKTMGFVRSQVRGAVAVQATALTAVALAVGVPAGVIAGRSAWNAFASDLGVIPRAAVPVVAILIAVFGALFLANVVAALPGRAAARTQPALALRTE